MICPYSTLDLSSPFSRVKSLTSVKHPSDERYSMIFSVSSDGTLRAWVLNNKEVVLFLTKSIHILKFASFT